MECLSGSIKPSQLSWRPVATAAVKKGRVQTKLNNCAGNITSKSTRKDGLTYTAIIAISLMVSAPAPGHHSDAGLDMESLVTLVGTVNNFFWRNPHVYFTIEAINENAEIKEWSLQMGSTITVSRMGWNRDTLSPGDQVSVQAHPSIDGRPYAYVRAVEKEGGLSSGEVFREPDVTIGATSLEGKWLAKLSEIPRYPGGFDGFFIANLKLTKKGIAARAAYDPLSADNPESLCIGRPTPAMIVSSTRYPIQIQFNNDEKTIEIRSQYWDEVRTIYMDGRKHPDSNKRFASGHSIGHWSGKTLVVDTRNFLNHRSPYQIGLPSGEHKHVVERYQLIEGGTRIAVEFMLEDPEYISEPMTHSRELIYTPQIPMSPFDCNPNATRMFMPLSN